MPAPSFISKADRDKMDENFGLEKPIGSKEHKLNNIMILVGFILQTGITWTMEEERPVLGMIMIRLNQMVSGTFQIFLYWKILELYLQQDLFQKEIVQYKRSISNLT